MKGCLEVEGPGWTMGVPFLAWEAAKQAVFMVHNLRKMITLVGAVLASTETT